MPRFNAAKSWKKLDDDLSGKFNYLCDLLDEGYSSVALINNHEIAIDINPKDGIKIVNDGSSIFSLDPLTGEIVIGKYDGLISDLETDLGTAYDDIAQQLGYADYDDMVAEAIAGNTIINGGWLRTTLIQANTILFDQLASSTVTSITDTIDLGGRNLLRNTGSTFTETAGWIGYGNHSTRIDSNVLVIDSTGAGNVSNNVVSYANVASGQEYTLSFSVYSASAQTVHVELWGSVGATDIAVTAGWQRVSCNLTGSSQPYFYIWLAAAGSVALNEIMLEKGNKATDWTPAPEDKLSEGVSYAGVEIDATNGVVTSATIAGKDASLTLNATKVIEYLFDGKKRFGLSTDGYVYANRLYDPDDESAYVQIGAVSGETGRSALTIYQTIGAGYTTHRERLRLKSYGTTAFAIQGIVKPSGTDVEGTTMLTVEHGDSYLILADVFGMAYLRHDDLNIGIDDPDIFISKDNGKTKFTIPEIQTGTGTSSSSAGGDTTVSFGKTFSSTPVVCANTTGANSYTCRIKSVSKTGFVLVVSGASIGFNYIAVAM